MAAPPPAGRPAPATPVETASGPPKKTPPAQWNTTTEETLIEEWGSEFTRMNQTNLAARHWLHVTKEVNEKRGDLPEFSVKQCQTKIDGLKAKYKEELKRKTSTGNVNSTWVHFNRLGALLEKLPKTIGIPNARDSSGVVESRASTSNIERDPYGVEHPDFPGQLEQGRREQNCTPDTEEGKAEKESVSSELHCATPAPAVSKGKKVIDLSPVSDLLVKHGSSVKGVKTLKRKRDGSEQIAASLDRFTEVYAAIATKTLEIQRSIAQDKADRDVKLAEMQIRFRMEFANKTD
jgi:hypothetical protein